MVNNTTGLDCLQQNKGDDNLALLGNITEKITVSANNDSYEATRNKMAEVEKERQGSRLETIFNVICQPCLKKNHQTGCAFTVTSSKLPIQFIGMLIIVK